MNGKQDKIPAMVTAVATAMSVWQWHRDCNRHSGGSNLSYPHHKWKKNRPLVSAL